MKVLPYLENPPKGSRKHRRSSTRRKATRAKTRVTKRAKTKRAKRRPPHGFSSWRTYMASIRPGAAAATHTGGTTMAAKKRRRRRSHASAPKRRYRRRNPPHFKLSLRSAPAFVMEASLGALVSTAGIVAARKGRGMVGQMAGTFMSSLIEASIGVVGGLVIAGFGYPRAGKNFAQGGLMAPTMTQLNQLAIPHISDAIGDDGVMVGGSTGLGLISAYPDDQPNLLVQGGGVGRGGSFGLGDGDVIQGTGDQFAGYVQGMTS